jgi:phosphomannomutase / phosphoglucomutase
MKINPFIFRTYDIRGVYPDDLNEVAARRIALSFAVSYPKAKKIVLARDPRLSSPILFSAIASALVESGKEVIDIGIAPDSLFFFSIFHFKFDGGIMISGSHNPKNHNGLTLHVRKPGKKISEDIIEGDLEKIRILAEEIDDSSKKVVGKIVKFDPTEKYLDYVSKKIKFKRPLKIVIDSGNGSVGYLPEKLFKKLGCQVETIYGESDGNFPNHLPDPYEEENIRDIKVAVLRKGADLGFAYDSDGDRVAIIDNAGEVIDGDATLLMLANQAISKKKGPVVHDMRVSKAFLDEMKKQGIQTFFSISHHNAVINKIIETDAVFGGEITLHFLFPLDYYLCDDALFASLKLTEIASAQNDFTKYVKSLPRYYTSPEIFINSTDEEKFKIIESLKEYLKKNNYDFIDIDGARINFPHGWALARAANTTPIIKCRFEGDTLDNLIEIERKSLKIFREIGIPINEETLARLNLTNL